MFIRWFEDGWLERERGGDVRVLGVERTVLDSREDMVLSDARIVKRQLLRKRRGEERQRGDHESL